jgi:hypothetical protein
VAGLLQKFEPAMFQGKPVCAYLTFLLLSTWIK